MSDPSGEAPASNGDADLLAPDVDRELKRLGATEEEIVTARQHGLVGLLAAVHAALPDEPKYLSGELAAKVGIDDAVAKRLWRAMGFADAGEGERIFTDADAEVLAVANASIAAGIATIDDTVQMTRVLASSMARIAEAMVSSTLANTESPNRTADELFALTVESVFDTYSKLLDYVWRRHLQAVLRRQLLDSLEQTDRGSTYAVGFADMVGFTALSQELEPNELADVVTRFEDLAFDHVARHGGRIAKVIGDEVMFVVRDTVAAVEMGLVLAETYAEDELLSDVRVGIACGDVLAHEGDYYGPVVNLASRIVNIAVPGSVVVSPSVYEALAGDDRYVFHALRSRSLKDIGRVRLWRVRRGHPSAS